MSDSLSIRSYSKQKVGHTHDFHQLVLPLRGVINIELAGFSGKVAPGECVVIQAGELHHFTSETEARFVVADMFSLPENLCAASWLVFTISQPLNRYLQFIETQLEYQVDSSLEKLTFDTFTSLLAAQRVAQTRDRRISAVVSFIDDNIGSALDISTLARIACLSATQFKKLFREQMGVSAGHHVTAMRMEKARALLIHTDLPVQRVAETVGYHDLSAFSRRFSAHFGLPPSKLFS